MNNDSNCNPNCSNYEKAIQIINDAAKYKPSCCCVQPTAFKLNNFLSLTTQNQTVAGNGAITFTEIISQNGTLITFTNPSSSILLEEGHTYMITVSVNGTSGTGEDLSLNAVANGNAISTNPILKSSIVAGYNASTASFYLTTTDDTLLTITNANIEDITELNASINIIAIA